MTNLESEFEDLESEFEDLMAKIADAQDVLRNYDAKHDLLDLVKFKALGTEYHFGYRYFGVKGHQSE